MDVTDELLLRERRDGDDDDDDVAWTGRGEPPWLTVAELNGSQLLLLPPPSGAAANRRFMATIDAYSVSFGSFRGFGYGSEDTI
jgi:hypothetical protein